MLNSPYLKISMTKVLESSTNMVANNYVIEIRIRGLVSMIMLTSHDHLKKADPYPSHAHPHD